MKTRNRIDRLDRESFWHDAQVRHYSTDRNYDGFDGTYAVERQMFGDPLGEGYEDSWQRILSQVKRGDPYVGYLQHPNGVNNKFFDPDGTVAHYQKGGAKAVFLVIYPWYVSCNDQAELLVTRLDKKRWAWRVMPMIKFFELRRLRKLIKEGD